MINYTKKSDLGTETDTVKLVTHVVLGIVFGILLLGVLFGSWTIIKPSEEGVVIRMGNINRQMASGFHWKMPWVEKVIHMDVSTKKIEVQASAASKDLQVVTTNMAVQYELNEADVSKIFVEYQKNNIRAKVIDPAIQDAVKASTALFNADELITKRAEVKDNIFALLNERLSTEGVFLKNVDIVNFDFSASFNLAIEEKVTAEQNAAREENKLKQVEFEAQQRVEQARGEAEAIRIQAQAIQSQGGKDYVNLQWIAAWEAGGAQVPTTIFGNGGANFLFNIK